MRPNEKNKEPARPLPDDPRDIPLFSIVEVARYLRMKPGSLAEWTRARVGYGCGNESFAPLIKAAGSGESPLSFYNALEAHMILGIRRISRVSMLSILRALEWVTSKSPSPHPLIDHSFQTDGKYLFASRLREEQLKAVEEERAAVSEIFKASLPGQKEIVEVINVFLDRIVRGDAGAAYRLFPITPNGNGTQRPVMMDVNLASGQLVIANSGVSASSVYGRFKNGRHSVAKLAEDYRLSTEQIKGAICYFEAKAA